MAKVMIRREITGRETSTGGCCRITSSIHLGEFGLRASWYWFHILPVFPSLATSQFGWHRILEMQSSYLLICRIVNLSLLWKLTLSHAYAAFITRNQLFHSWEWLLQLKAIIMFYTAYVLWNWHASFQLSSTRWWPFFYQGLYNHPVLFKVWKLNTTL